MGALLATKSFQTVSHNELEMAENDIAYNDSKSYGVCDPGRVGQLNVSLCISIICILIYFLELGTKWISLVHCSETTHRELLTKHYFNHHQNLETIQLD